MIKLRRGPWNLTDLKEVPKNGLKVFSCFHCGGGSSMGYKLAGYEVLGGVEIDPQMMKVYRANHNPKHSYLMGVQHFNTISRADLPEELLKLDILDGSPPCSSFSMAGSREKAWGEKKKFREGQASQVLDDLFFQFIETARILQPKVVVAENVKGLVIGKAKGYVKQIFNLFSMAGYDCQLFLLNAAFMGVPQRRERTFFIARRKDLDLPKIKLEFSEQPITPAEAFVGTVSDGKHAGDKAEILWRATKPGDSLSTAHEKGSWFTWTKLAPNKVAGTVHSGPAQLHWQTARHLSDTETVRLQTFPDDYDFGDHEVRYICGMSVPPFMMQRIAHQIEAQLLRGLNG